MGGTSGDLAEAGIERLEEHFGSFPVNQTTLGASEREYERVREQTEAGTIVAYVRVRNDDGDVLHVDGEDRSVPQCACAVDDAFAGRIRERVRAETGVECRVDGVDRVTIAGVRREGASEETTVYRLVALVDADREDGTPDGAVWRSGEASLPEYV